jgi:hypothetical protein
MNNEKQTAVEWLVSQQKHNKFFDIETIEIAKAMHKKEIKDAIFWGNIKGYDEHKRTCIHDEDEQYYNETYGGDK